MDFHAIAQQIADAYEPPITGRPSALTNTESVAELLTAIEEGSYLATACDLAGIHENTVAAWLKRGEAGEEPFKTFQWAYKRACARAEHDMVTEVRKAAKAGPQYWAAGMTYLERRQPDKWGKRQDDSNQPKVIVQIGVSQGDVQVSLGPSPQLRSPDSETLQIQAITATESDKQGYVNQAKLLTAQSIDVPTRKRSEAGKRKAKGPARRGKRREAPARAVASKPAGGGAE
jgi:hypothetical protein